MKKLNFHQRHEIKDKYLLLPRKKKSRADFSHIARMFLEKAISWICFRLEQERDFSQRTTFDSISKYIKRFFRSLLKFFCSLAFIFRSAPTFSPVFLECTKIYIKNISISCSKKIFFSQKKKNISYIHEKELSSEREHESERITLRIFFFFHLFFFNLHF